MAKKLGTLGRVMVYGRLSFPALANPEKPPQEGKPRYAVHLLIPKDGEDHKLVMEVCREVFLDKWGKLDDVKRKATWNEITNNPMRFFVRDGDTKAYDGYAGNVELSAYNTLPAQRPTCIDQRRNALSPDQIEQTFYSGCYVNCILNIWAQDNKAGKGIRASTGGVQFAKDGERFSGAAIAKAEEFEEIEDISAEDAGDFGLV